MDSSLDKIDDMIAYIESPDYLRMVASAQGENAYALLNSEPHNADTNYDPPIVFDNLDIPEDNWAPTYPSPSRNTLATRVRRNSRTIQLSTRSGWWEFLPALRDRLPFKTYGQFYGTNDVTSHTGRLPEGYAARFRGEYPLIDYVVYSYATPIAWHVNSGVEDWYWVIPDHSYSPTTSRHQNKIRVALAESGEAVAAQ